METGCEDRAVSGLRELILAGEALRSAVAAHFGCGVRETEAVSYLVARGDLTAGGLARELGLSPATSTDLIDRLERAGLATRSINPRNRRQVLVHATDLAHRHAAEVRDAFAESIAAAPHRGCLSDALWQIALALRDQAGALREQPAVTHERSGTVRHGTAPAPPGVACGDAQCEPSSRSARATSL